MKYVIEINSKCESRAVQEHAFKLGAAWIDSGASYYDINGKQRIRIEEGEMYCGTSHQPTITVDEFLALETLEAEKPFEFSSGCYRVGYAKVLCDPNVYHKEVAGGFRFDTQEQAERAHKAVLTTLADQQRLCWEENKCKSS